MQIKRGLNLLLPINPWGQVLTMELSSYFSELANLLNKGLQVSDNFNAQIVTVTDTGLVNTEFVVAHTLKQVPIGFIVINIDKAGVVYNSGTIWTTANIYLKCSVASCLTKLIILSG